MNCLNVFSVVVSRFRIIVALITRERLYFFSCDQRDYNTETRNNHRKHIETIHEPEGFSLGHNNRTILTNRLLAVSDMSLPVVAELTGYLR